MPFTDIYLTDLYVCGYPIEQDSFNMSVAVKLSLLLSIGLVIVNEDIEDYKTQASANPIIPPCSATPLGKEFSAIFYSTESYNCTFPPRRNNGNRQSCQILFSRKSNESYCYIDPDGLPVYCTAAENDVSCRCIFYKSRLDNRVCQIIAYHLQHFENNCQ